MTAAFRDPFVEPTAAGIRAVLGAAGEVWDQLSDLMAERGVAVAWRYYNDGGWLAKATRGSRTVAWLNVVPGCAKVTFYFPGRHRDLLVEHPDLSAPLRDRLATTALIGRSLPVSLEVHDGADVAEVGAVLGIKLRV